MIKSPSLLANLFSNSFVKKIINQQHNPLLETILLETNFKKTLAPSIPLKTALLKVFKYLNKNYRCEYVYKTGVLNELLLRRHDLEKSIYLTEFRAFNAKADILILNGTSSVYEIKSDIDNLDRLYNQVTVYQKIFDKVFVVTNAGNITKIKSIVPKNIGIIILNKDLSIETDKDAVSNMTKLNKELMFASMRKQEYTKIINDAYGAVPDVPGTLIFSACSKLFHKLSNEEAHSYFLEVLKNRRLSEDQIRLIKNSNISLKGILSDRFYTKNECNLLNFGLNQSIR